MLFKKLYFLLLSLLLMACSPHYNEQDITNSEMLQELEPLKVVLAKYNIVELSYFSDEVLVLNGIVLNPIKSTFGLSPDSGFMETYTEKATKKSYTKWKQLLAKTQPLTNVTQEQFHQIMADMAQIGVTDMFNDKQFNIIRIQWGNSIMWGINGLIIGDAKNAAAFQKHFKYDVFKQVSDGVYFFQLL
ncbi:hypothetical protein JK628_05250 [Shewanella sp. KX20019]|uniref:hypothetical protein n=1 Tax=Shewanella sp. KX20019 TaxID=2803864 RepID=UPI00192655C0|nr:hypothetical protein [Shewanella sp. KX20019]QQX81278.1 hypothetical protein JK628_05250 [Shewanella sp. KX20019]